MRIFYILKQETFFKNILYFKIDGVLYNLNYTDFTFVGNCTVFMGF